MPTDRVQERWNAIEPRLIGKTLLDIGAYKGDFVKLAVASGLSAKGVDITPVDSYVVTAEATTLTTQDLKVDNILLLSTWAYIVRDHGKVKALAFLKRVVKNSEKLFFETQLSGDGPGPSFLKTDADVVEMFFKLGAVKAYPLITLNIEGRDAKRTVFEVA